jgi:DNA repair exonuclease SbcCD ATPase subunit
VYENLESAQQVLTSCNQKLTENAATIEKLQAEKTQFAEYIAKHDLYALKRDLEKMNEQIANYENSVQILDTEEAKKWTLKTKKEWTQFYIKVQDTLSRSEIIAQTWNERKEAIQKEINTLECASISFEKSLVNVADWENLSVKIKKIEQDIPMLEQKMLETAPDIPVQLEEMISKFQELFHEFEKHQCKIQSLRLQLKDTGKMQINPDCKACIKNSLILKQALQEKELQERERNEQYLVEKMKKLALDISQHWVDVANHSSVEEMNSFLRKRLEHLKQEKVDFMKRKETTQKKLTLYLTLQQNYVNTKNFKLVEENNQKLVDLKKRLASDPAKKEYEDMLVFFKNTKIYQEVAQYWEKQNDISLTDLKQKQEKLCKTISKYEKRVQRLAEAEKSLSEIATNKVKDELELKSIQEQIQILKNNQKLNKKLQELDSKKASNKTILDERTRLLHKYQTDLEKNTIYKREWEINMEKWKNCKETIDTMQLLVNCIDRDGLPLYLLKMYLPMIENEINQLIYTFLDKKMVLRVVDKDVIVGVEACSDNVSNYLGGMESFMVDLSLKMVFSKFSRQPKSNFFIIDEGISVLDQERLSNIHVLFNFLTSISEQVFLISHIPSIKDFVTQSIEIMKDEKGYSHANCFF